MSEELEIFKKKLLYRASYRGTKEMDILLTKFVKKYLNSFNYEQLRQLEKFLEFEDEIIYDFYNFDKVKKEIDKNKISEIFKNFKI
ncbi:succinate dehydrogenase assembly factor 2 [Candidatus Pelagibacter communis]|uniref:succinate dehydrogenase assembly factor 2 n=1 Tax=Pelagibacter ubique TaxID=198252 RepID=UPI00094CF563|nr:succinate dehydrogenase assembly factor 2 [Candidatus Pelagibacter ubique]